MEQDTFDPHFFDQLRQNENSFFWFHVRRKWIFDKLKIFVRPPAKLLEVGCGTGNVSSFLAQKGYLVTGCDCFPQALEMAWPGFQKVQGDATDLPFEDNTFDIVGLFDVIEHFQDDISPIKEAARVVREGGIIAITVPAGEELWSWVDEIASHKRRYTKKYLTSVLLEAKLRPCATDYMFMSLFFPMKYMRRRKTEISNSFEIHGGLNLMLKTIFNTERLISNFVPLPIGTSLIAIARKEH